MGNMKAMIAILVLAFGACAVNGMTTMNPMSNSSMNNDNNTAPGNSNMPPQLPGGITVRKEGINMRDMRAISAADLKTSVQSMTTSQQDDMCQGVMNGGGDRATMANLAAAGVDCFAAMTRDPTARVDPGQAMIQMELKRQTTSPANWGTSDWSTAFKSMGDAVSSSDIKQMGSSTVRSLVQSGDLQGSSAMNDPSNARAMEAQLKTAYGQPTAWTNDTLREMGPLLSTMEPSTLKSIPASELKDAAPALRDITFDDPTKKAAMGSQLVEGLGKNAANSWSADDVANADQYIRSNPAIIGKLNDSAITGSLTTLGSRSTDVRGATQIASRLKSIPGYSDPSSLDSSKVSEMGHLMKGMGKSYLANLTASAISGALTTLANVSFSREEARELAAKVKGTLSTYDSSRIKELGHLITGLDDSDLDQIPSSALADALTDIQDKDFSVSQCLSIKNKVKAAGTSNLKNMGALMSKCMGPDDFDSTSVDDLGLNCASSTAVTFIPDKATAKKLMDKVKLQMGNPSGNSNYSLTCIKNWDRVAALGMNADDFENLPDNGDFASVIENLALYESEMDESQTKAIAKRVRIFLDMDNATAVMSHDSTVIEQVGKFLKHFNDSDLTKFNTSVKPVIARKLGEANLDTLPTSDIERLKTFSLQNVLRDDTSAVTDRTSATSLDDNDIRDMGNVMSGITSTEINKLSSSAISSNLNNMQDTVQGLEDKKAVINRAASQDSTFFDSAENVVGAAGLAGGIETDKLNNMNETVLGEALSDVAAQLEERETKDAARSKAFSSEISTADKNTISSNKDAFVQKAFTGYQNSQTSTTSRRKRRSTTTITCSDVQTLGSNAVSLTTSQLDTLSTSEFTDCTETLGAITGWSSAQLTSLVSRAKATYGTTVSTWSSTNVRLLGTINAGLTTTEISSLALSSASILSIMGTSSSFSSAQLKAGFTRFLSQARSNTASTVTGDDLMTIGSFACGAETSQIDAFTSANYQTAASSIGSQTTCDASQLTSYANLAKTAYGAVNTWATSTITTVGVVIGGLTDAEIAALTTAQIATISTTTISSMPANKIAAFSDTQLSGFTSSQANAVTADQQNALSSSQLSALVSAGATDRTTSAAAITMHATFMLLLPILALFL